MFERVFSAPLLSIFDQFFKIALVFHSLGLVYLGQPSFIIRKSFENFLGEIWIIHNKMDSDEFYILGNVHQYVLSLFKGQQ